uniref:Uncharacterized protein n=1 Tax=Anguilla anguilla TaxID=7936 RepID=A0A0E9TZB4_ANGAN
MYQRQNLGPLALFTG